MAGRHARPRAPELARAGIWNDTALVHEIERRSGETRPTPDEVVESVEQPRNVRHYLYHPRKPQAARLAAAVKRLGLECELRRSGDATNWRILVIQPPSALPDDVSTAARALERLAASFGAEYDGFEVPVAPSSDPTGA